MQREAYFNFTRLCSNLFYIMMLVGREGGGVGGGGRGQVFFFNAFRCFVCAPRTIKDNGKLYVQTSSSSSSPSLYILSLLILTSF